MLWIWFGFVALILVILALDLGVFHRKAHAVGLKEALGWSAVWIAFGLAFSLFVYAGYENRWSGLGTTPDPVDGALNDGRTATEKYLTGYVVETTDLIFAVDSIPAIFAILGLRSLYFTLAGMMDRFRYLKISLALVLLLVGVKMLLAEWLKLALGRHFNLYLLMAVLSILAAGIAASFLAEVVEKRRGGKI